MQRLLPLGAPIHIPFVVTSVAVFINKSPRLTHEWSIHIGSPRNPPQATSRPPAPVVDAASAATTAAGSGGSIPSFMMTSSRRRTSDDAVRQGILGHFKARAAAVGKPPGHAENRTGGGGGGGGGVALFDDLVATVVFELDRSFHDPVRTITRPPFVTTGDGWGEHCVTIRVHFRPELQLPAFVVLHSVLLHVTIPMPLVLHSENVFTERPAKRLVMADDAAKPCVAQRRDTIVLQNASRQVYRQILALSRRSSRAGHTARGRRDDPVDVKGDGGGGAPPLPLPRALEAVLRDDGSTAFEAEGSSSAVLTLSMEGLEEEAQSLLAAIVAKDARLDELLGKARAQLAAQEARCERIAKARRIE